MDARIELDLRIGAAFTRLQTIIMQRRFGALDKKVISFGPCQFPTLGFVVDQFRRVESFVSEPFWYLVATTKHGGGGGGGGGNDSPSPFVVTFTWSRGHLFDMLATLFIYESCLLLASATPHQVPILSARVTSVTENPKSKWRPLPLTTVELQKAASTRLRMTSDRVMHVAESLYCKGYISYPRTETDQFDGEFKLEPLVRIQANGGGVWSEYAAGLLSDNGAGGGSGTSNKFSRPFRGRNNDKAHPPIHPTKEGHALEDAEERRVFEFVARRFLAACSHDAVGSETIVEIDVAGELFTAKGNIINAWGKGMVELIN